jgi:hypothetical protein
MSQRAFLTAVKIFESAVNRTLARQLNDNDHFWTIEKSYSHEANNQVFNALTRLSNANPAREWTRADRNITDRSIVRTLNM